MKKITLLLLIVFIRSLGMQELAGQLDPTFGTEGKVITGAPLDQALAGILQPDGKIIAAGISFAFGFALARYNSDGSLDTSSFNPGGFFPGIVTTSFGGAFNTVHGLVLQPDNKIVAAGNGGAAIDFALARYNSDGSLDPSFGIGGLVTTNIVGTDFINELLLQPDGKLVGVGESTSGFVRFALARYNADGSLDLSFGTGGIVIETFAALGATNARANAGILQPDGKIIALGDAQIGGIFHFALARFNPDGSLDTSFGMGGLVITDFPGTGNDRIRAGVLKANGKIIAGGQSGSILFALAQYNPNGTLDSTFGTNGLVTTSFPGGTAIIDSLALQPGNKIVAVGGVSFSGAQDFALARYIDDGSLDPNFGTNGLVTTDFTGATDIGHVALIQPDNKIIAVGEANLDFALARYTGQVCFLTDDQLCQMICNKYAPCCGLLP